MHLLKKTFLFLLMFLFIITANATGCSQTPDEKVNLNIAAAVSLKDALNEIRQKYQAENPNIKLSFNLASSGTLQKQIEQGAPEDVFISAGEQQMDALVREGLVQKDTLIQPVGNELVLIVPDKNPEDVKSLLDLADKNIKIAIGTPETVPAGKYARESLSKLGLWDKVKDRLVYTKDVRQVLAYVESGNVDAGLVYRSDALTSKEVQVASSAPVGTHSAIVYPAAVTRNAAEPEAAKKFLEYLKGSEARKIFAKYRFKV